MADLPRTPSGPAETTCRFDSSGTGLSFAVSLGTRPARPVGMFCPALHGRAMLLCPGRDHAHRAREAAKRPSMRLRLCGDRTVWSPYTRWS
jgi:hypothetical protein